MVDSSLEKVTREPIWERAIYLFLFLIMLKIAVFLLVITAVLHFIFEAGKSDGRNLKLFIGDLQAYLKQIIHYLFDQNREKPFPFSDWPDAGQA